MLEVAVYQDFPPYSYVEKGVQKGIDVDIAKELAKRLSVAPTVRMVGADENVEDDLRNNVWKGHYLGGGVADAMLHAPVDKQFSETVGQVSFIAPYQTEQLFFAVDTAKLGKTPTIANFTSASVGVELDTLSDLYLLRAMNGKVAPNIHHYKNVPEAVAALRKGEIAGVMGPRAELEGALQDKPANIAIQHLTTTGMARDSWAVGLAVKAKHKNLTSALNTAMAAMVEDGTMQKIFTSYGVTYQPPAAPPKTETAAK